MFSLIVESFDPPSPILVEDAVFQPSGYPCLIVVQRSVIEECAHMVRDIFFHFTKTLALNRPPAIEVSSMRKEIYVEVATARVPKKMPSIGGKGAIT